MNPYAEYAHVYVERGWVPLPLPYGQKFPPPKGFTGRTGKAPTPALIESWCVNVERSNIALRLADDVIGIDVDDYDGKGGGETLDDWELRYGLLPATVRVTSREDGISGIRMYRVPTGRRWAEGLGPGVEIVQAGHRYAVAWPSIHPDTKEPYRWYSDIRTEAGGSMPGYECEIPKAHRLRDLPAAWVDALTVGSDTGEVTKPERDRAAIDAWLRTLRGGEPCARSKATLADRLDQLGASGSRHDEMTRAVFELVALGAEGHAGMYGALRTYRAAFVDAVDGSRVGGASEAGREYLSALTGAVARFMAELPAQECDCEPDAPELKGWDFFPAGVLTTPMATPPAVWGAGDAIGWGSGQSLMLFGPTGVGKSTLALQLVWARLGLSTDVLGMPVIDDGGRVLYVAADRPSQLLMAMQRLLGERDPTSDATGRRLIILNGPPPGNITKDAGLLLGAVRELGATTVVLDSIKDMMANPSDEEAANGYNLARQALLRNGVELLELHHARKVSAEQSKAPRNLSEVYGSTWLTAGAGSVLGLYGVAGAGTVDLEHLKLVKLPLTVRAVTIDYASGAVTAVGSDRESAASGMTARDVLLSASSAGVSAAEVASLASVTADAARRTASRMVTDGLLEKVGNGRWRPAGADVFGEE